MSKSLRKIGLIYASGMLAASCLISVMTPVASLADSEYPPYTEEITAEVGKTYNGSGTPETNYTFFFTPAKSGAYQLDLEEKAEGHGYINVYEKIDNYEYGLWCYGNTGDVEDAYAYFEKGHTYRIDLQPVDMFNNYDFTVKEATYGASAIWESVIKPGEEVTFKVNAASDKPVTYSWFKGTEELGINTDSYSMKPDKVTNEYTCNIDFGNGVKTSCMFYCRIESGFSIKGTPLFNGKDYSETKTVFTKPNTPFELEAETITDSYTGEVFYQWSANGVIIKDATGPKLEVKDGISKATVYECSAWDEYSGESINSWSSSINVGIENNFKLITADPTEIVLNGTTTADLKVEFTANDTSDMSFTWNVWRLGSNNEEHYESKVPEFKLENVNIYASVRCEIHDKYNNTYFVYFDVVGDKTKSNDVSAFVERCYLNILKRESDLDGRTHWISKLNNYEMTGAEVARFFIGSDEFLKSDITNDAFIDILYSTFFGREADADGKAYWTGKLASGEIDRATAVESFIYSKEWANLCAEYGILSGTDIVSDLEHDASPEVLAFVERMYTTALGREAEAEGKAYWAHELANHRTTGEMVGLLFFTSDEFIGQNVNVDEFITRLFKTFMDREPDPDGFNFWKSVAEGGTYTTFDIIDSFTRSPEFAERCSNAGIIPYAKNF